MATITRNISTKVNTSGDAEILLRLTVSRSLRLRLKSGIYMNPKRFKDGAIIMPRANQKEAKVLNEIEKRLTALEQLIVSACIDNPQEELSQEFFRDMIDRFNHPDKYEVKKVELTFFGLFNEYLEKHPLSAARANHYKVLARALRRFEMYIHKTENRKYKMTIDNFTTEWIEKFGDFLKAEPELFDKYPEIYKEVPAVVRTQRKPKRPLPKGANTICCTFKRFRAFYNWCIERGYTQNNPFANFKGIGTEKYGRPYYISVAEVEKIADFDLSANPALAVQRDIFVFQCLIGCRVSDLMRMTDDSVIDGAVEYIPDKTKGERPEVLRVPLNNRAKEILSRYADSKKGNMLLPFISPQKYNDAIKKIFTQCGITRIVTVLNPTTGNEEKRPINEIASSHLARRTFIGNIYKEVKDPNLVGALSGHKEGSKAFARYRDIDEEMKQDLVNILG